VRIYPHWANKFAPTPQLYSSDFPWRTTREALNKSFPFMVRQAHHEQNQYVTVHPELVEGLNQRFPTGIEQT